MRSISILTKNLAILYCTSKAEDKNKKNVFYNECLSQFDIGLSTLTTYPAMDQECGGLLEWNLNEFKNQKSNFENLKSKFYLSVYEIIPIFFAFFWNHLLFVLFIQSYLCFSVQSLLHFFRPMDCYL